MRGIVRETATFFFSYFFFALVRCCTPPPPLFFIRFVGDVQRIVDLGRRRSTRQTTSEKRPLLVPLFFRRSALLHKVVKSGEINGKDDGLFSFLFLFM